MRDLTWAVCTAAAIYVGFLLGMVYMADQRPSAAPSAAVDLCKCGLACECNPTASRER